MLDDLKLKNELDQQISAITNSKELEEARISILGKKGIFAELMLQMRDLPKEEKKDFGQKVNELKKEYEEKINSLKEELEIKQMEKDLVKDKIDITLPSVNSNTGNYHPLTNVLLEIEKLFISMGYNIALGPEVELDKYNFERANIPANHPARDMQDTFYINSEYLLRTHTTAIQTRTLENNHENLPIKIICPGKTYRRDDDDATHSHQFFQVEGIVVGENISMGDLKGTLELFAKKMFGEKRVIRFRPSYFQFTEPSVEVDVSCHICNGKGCNICKNTGWIEILGAGMVHPNVLEMAGIDSTKYSGFAFGIGLERVAMLKYGVDDIRHFYTNDVRFLKNFKRFD
ncbi:MAG: phenylalanine--tRNA ligase subunit alpha [Erysipelotrichaceae bacterium]